MPVIDRGLESYEVEEGLSKMKGGKALELDQCSVEFVKKGGRSRVVWLVRLFNCCFKTREFQGTGAGHALFRCRT